MLVGIAQQESGLETMILHDNISGRVLHGAGVIDAATQLIATGHSVDLGAWQINSRNLALLGLGIADAFEPCKSVAAAARLIELFSRYNTGSPSRGIANGYAPAVMASIHSVKAANPGASAMPAMAEPPTSAPTHSTSHREPAGTSYSQPKGIVDVLVHHRPDSLNLRHRHVRDDAGDHRRRDCGARAMLHGSWGHFWSAIGGGAILVCASWVVQTFLSAG